MLLCHIGQFVRCHCLDSVFVVPALGSPHGIGCPSQVQVVHRGQGQWSAGVPLGRDDPVATRGVDSPRIFESIAPDHVGIIESWFYVINGSQDLAKKTKSFWQRSSREGSMQIVMMNVTSRCARFSPWRLGENSPGKCFISQGAWSPLSPSLRPERDYPSWLHMGQPGWSSQKCESEGKNWRE